MCQQRVILSFLLLALSPLSGFGSSAIAIITPQGIVLGVDAKSAVRCDGPCPQQLRESTNLVRIEDRVAIATVGLRTVLGNPHIVASYYFPAFVERIKTRLPPSPAVSQVVEIVQQIAEETFLSSLDSCFRLGLVKRSDFASDHPVEYLIAGYEAQIPMIYSVYVEVDWQRTHLQHIQQVLIHPKTMDEDSGIYSVGSSRLLQQLEHHRGNLYRTFRSKLPFESRMLRGKKVLSLKQAVSVVGALLEIEASANPDQVGPPFTIVTIPKEPEAEAYGSEAR